MPLDPAVTRDGDRICRPGQRTSARRIRGPIHGLAMDLGTTTVVVRLINLETGELVADASFENPQRFGGSDVMSRIHYDTEHRGQAAAGARSRGYLTHAIEEFPVDPETIYEVVVVGNSTMRDLFFRQNVYTIGQNPYRSITEIEMAAGTADDDQPDRDRPALPAADPPGGARLRPADHQRPRRRRRRRVHARRRPGARGSSRRRSWTSAPTPS